MMQPILHCKPGTAVQLEMSIASTKKDSAPEVMGMLVTHELFSGYVPR